MRLLKKWYVRVYMYDSNMANFCTAYRSVGGTERL